MCFKSSSSSSTSQQTKQYDNRVGAADGSIVAAHGSSVNVLDGGAIQAAKELGLKALSGNEEIAREAIGYARVLGTGALSAIADNADKAFEFVDKQRQDSEARAFNSAIPWLVGGASVVAITLALRSN